MGTSRDRGKRDGRAEVRHQSELGFGIWRSPAGAAGCGLLRSKVMTEVLFYHLQNMSLESVLPSLLEKSLERGWRVVVQSTSQERADALDAHLWTYRDDSFLPHATWLARDAPDQPIVLVVEEANPNRANVRVLIDNAALPADSHAYHRVVLVFNGDDGEALALARGAWTDCKARGFEGTYWQPDDGGRWQRRRKSTS